MGCFSYICKECGEPILSNAYRGQQVKLFLLQKGKVIESMEGEYDAYGRVFTPSREDSVNWQMPWTKVCNLTFNSDPNSGMAAVHSKCFRSNPTSQSLDDPNQGWGTDGEYFPDSESLQAIP